MKRSDIRPTSTINPPSLYGHGRLIVEYVASTGPRMDRLHNVSAGLHVSAIGTITTVTTVPDDESDFERERPDFAWVILTATDGTSCTAYLAEDRYLALFGDVAEGFRVEVYGVVRTVDMAPPYIEARTVRVLSRHSDSGWGVTL